MAERGRSVGVVVVGTGFGCLTHVRGLRAAGFDVLGLVGRDPDRTAERARRFEIPHALTSLAAAIALPDVEAVTIATPPLTHAPLALEAMAAGKHVVCEKPFARDAAEGQQVLEAAEGAGVVHMLGTEFRWATGQALTRRFIQEGGIGEARLATFLLHIPLLASPAGQVPDWWSDAGQGGGWLGAHAAHVIDQIRTCLGEFEGVSAALPLVADRPLLVEGDWTAEDSYTAHFRLRTGVEGVMQSTAADWGPPILLTRVVGTTGTTWTDEEGVWVSDRSGTRVVPVPDDLRLGAPEPPPADLLMTAYDLLHSTGIEMGPYTRLFETFYDRILGRPVPADPPPATFADGVADMAVLDAIRRSASERAWVPVPEPATR